MATAEPLISYARSKGCSLYILLNGYLAYRDPRTDAATNATLHYPFILLTNCTSDRSYNLTADNFSPPFFSKGFISATEKISNISRGVISKDQSVDPNLIRNPFLNGFISICYVLSGVTVAAWSLVLLLILSTTRKSRISSILVLFYAITISIVLSKTTDLLDTQFILNYQDADEFKSKVLQNQVSFGFSLGVWLLTISSWGEILINLFSIQFKRIILYSTAASFILLLIFNVLRYIFDQKYDAYANTLGYPFEATYNYQHQDFKGDKKLRTFFSIMISIVTMSVYVMFTGCMYFYISMKKEFAFKRPTAALTIFTSILLLCPVLFYIMLISSNIIDNCIVILIDFFPVLISILIWELFYKIQRLEKINERKTILGRQILNDELPKTKASPYKPKRSKQRRVRNHRALDADDVPGVNENSMNDVIVNPQDRNPAAVRGICSSLNQLANRPINECKVFKKDFKSSLKRFIRPHHSSNSGLYHGNNDRSNKNNHNNENIQLHNLTEIQVGTPVDPQIQTSDSPVSEYHTFINTKGANTNAGSRNVIIHHHSTSAVAANRGRGTENGTPLSYRTIHTPIDEVLMQHHGPDIYGRSQPKNTASNNIKDSSHSHQRIINKGTNRNS